LTPHRIETPNVIEIKFGPVDCVRKMTLVLNFMHVDPLGAF